MKCKCRRKAVFFRKYEGRALCSLHFPESIERKAKRTIGKNELIKPGDRIAVALSGGKDSCAALYMMNMIVKPRRDMELVAITVDVGLKAYKEGIKASRDFCRKLGVKHYVFSYKEELGKSMDQLVKEMRRENPKLKKTEVCSACSVAKRWVLNKKARELGCMKVCTGHNLDDEVQSIFMNYMRGDLLRASRSEPEPVIYDKRFIPRIKPLREIPEEEVALYVKLRGFRCQGNRCPYRGGIRYEIGEFMDSLEKRHAGIKFAFLESFEKILPHFKKAAEKGERIRYCRACGEPCSDEVCSVCGLWKK